MCLGSEGRTVVFSSLEDLSNRIDDPAAMAPWRSKEDHRYESLVVGLSRRLPPADDPRHSQYGRSTRQSFLRTDDSANCAKAAIPNTPPQICKDTPICPAMGCAKLSLSNNIYGYMRFA